MAGKWMQLLHEFRIHTFLTYPRPRPWFPPGHPMLSSLKQPPEGASKHLSGAPALLCSLPSRLSTSPIISLPWPPPFPSPPPLLAHSALQASSLLLHTPGKVLPSGPCWV